VSEIFAFTAVVHGRVQGVNFRYFVIQRARTLDLKGYVVNLRNGISVEVYAEGEKSKLNELLSSLYIGPSRAEVDHLDVTWSKALGQLNRFEVKY
jgi:acylphosphatase